MTELFGSNDVVEADSALSDSALEIETAESFENKTEEVILSEAALSSSALTAAVSADLSDDAEVVISGSCGDNAAYTLYDNGELVISETGDMTNYSSAESCPWYYYRTTVTSIVIEDSVTSIGAFAFYNCSSLQEAMIPESVTSMDDSAFYGCSSIENFMLPRVFM